MQGSAVLVHGAWGSPEDWRWVSDPLRDYGVQVRAPDLPSHRLASADHPADVAEVADVIAAADPPVVAVGWSYGGLVIGDAAARCASVTRLLYVSDVPRLPGPEPDLDAAREGVKTDPHLLALPDDKIVLDDEWWLTEGLGVTLPDDVQRHLWTHRRRPMSLAAFIASPLTAVWQTIATTVLLGTSDELIDPEDRNWVAAQVDDLRWLQTDHFVLWRQPDAIVSIVIEALSRGERHSAPP